MCRQVRKYSGHKDGLYYDNLSSRPGEHLYRTGNSRNVDKTERGRTVQSCSSRFESQAQPFLKNG